MRSRAKKGKAVVVIAIIAMLVNANASRGETSALLKKLSLSEYSPGTRPPDFAGRTTDGREVLLASLQGKVVLVNFWATWCLECRPEMPALERLHHKFSAQGLAVIGINAREGTATIRERRRTRVNVSASSGPVGEN